MEMFYICMDILMLAYILCVLCCLFKSKNFVFDGFYESNRLEESIPKLAFGREVAFD